MTALYKGVAATSVFSLVGFFLLLNQNMPLFLVTVIGVATTALMFIITEYYTAKEHAPVKQVANAAKTGAGTNLISGLAVGLESTLLPCLVVVAATLLSFKLGGLYGEISINSRPPRATVIFDGDQIGARTPVTIRRVPRDKLHSVRIQLDGYRQWESTVNMSDNDEKKFDVELERN